MYMRRKNTDMGKTISVESRVAMSLRGLGSGNSLCTSYTYERYMRWLKIEFHG